MNVNNHFLSVDWITDSLQPVSVNGIGQATFSFLLKHLPSPVDPRVSSSAVRHEWIEVMSRIIAYGTIQTDNNQSEIFLKRIWKQIATLPFDKR